MQELKPVAWMRSEVEKADCQFGYYGSVKCYPDDVPLYALPDTHRIVSVELLQCVEQFVAQARDHYSGMNDEVCQSYSEP